MAELNFNAQQVAPEFGVDTVPAGWYNAMIDESEMKPTKDGLGAYLAVRFTVVDGHYANRKLFMRLNLRNSNPTAQEIAYKQLSAIAHAVGVLQVQDSAQLHGIPMKVKVKVRKDSTGEYEDSNEITSIKNINEQVQMASAPAASGAPAGFGAPSGVPAGFGAPAGFNSPAPAPVAAPAQWQAPAPQAQPMQPQAVPEATWQQPTGQQPWQQTAPQSAPQGAPVAQPAPQAQQWQAPQTAPQTAPATAPAVAPGFNPQTATPPWQQQPQG